MKCIPLSKISSAHGRILHDSHAEILSLRSFNHFLLQECGKLAEDERHSSRIIVRRTAQEVRSSGSSQPFAIKPGLKIHMYCSEVPCGDASMEIVMRAQQDSTPWLDSGGQAGSSSTTSLKGRGYFSELGIVRRKPARGDSPPSLSKSCSDKLALKQCTSLLSSVISTLIHPERAYLTSLVVPREEYVESAFVRSFSPIGRMSRLANSRWPGCFAFQAVRVETTSQQFDFSRRSIAETTSDAKGSNICAVWNPHLQETLINGVMQGWRQDNPRGASSISRAKIASGVCVTMKKLGYGPLISFGTYRDLKNSELARDYRQVKRDAIAKALVGWAPNVEDSFDI